MSKNSNWAHTWWPPIGDTMEAKPTITDFLLARITEDEEVARGAISPSGYNTSPDGRWEIIEVPYEGEWPRNPDAENVVWSQSEWALHASRHDPARVLAECAAKRKIIADRERIDRNASDTEWAMGYSDANYSALRALAAVYSDHPGYRSEWSMS